MDIDIAGKVVVVTGAAQGIGRTLALGLAAEGARVAVIARDRKRAQAVAGEIGGPAALAVEADVSDEAAVIAAAAEIDGAWGRVDALINNAGWMPGYQPVLTLEVSVLERVLRSNLVSSFLTTKHFAPLMIRGGGAGSSTSRARPASRPTRAARRTAAPRPRSTSWPTSCIPNSPTRASGPSPSPRA
jgi:NAD(P)-dependent dehydrogenase (short-subunit alcohol dehydrogenase family)